MNEPTAESQNALPDPGKKPPLNYAHPAWGRREMTPEQLRGFLLWSMGVLLAFTLAWWVAMFCACRPNIDFFCICAFAPLILAATWFALGEELWSFVRKYPQRRPWLFRVIIGAAFFLAPYNFIRAGGDMFELSVRFHLWRAGGVQKVRAQFNQFVAGRPAYSEHEKILFGDFPANGGNFVPLPASKLPPTVRYMDRHFPSRSGRAWDGVAYLDNVSVLTTTDIAIGPPGWEPEGGARVRDHIFGGRRKVADGIWILIGTYDK